MQWVVAMVTADTEEENGEFCVTVGDVTSRLVKMVFCNVRLSRPNIRLFCDYRFPAVHYL